MKTMGNELTIKIKMEEGYEDLFPSYGYGSGTAAFDIKAAETCVILSKKHKYVELKLSSEIPEGYAAFIYARSGLGGRLGIRPSNCVGIIDANYRGNWGAVMRNDSDDDYTINYGDKICQVVIQKVERVNLLNVNELAESERGNNGWGSTGK